MVGRVLFIVVLVRRVSFVAVLEESFVTVKAGKIRFVLGLVGQLHFCCCFRRKNGTS
jgi:hypothetical protein